MNCSLAPVGLAALLSVAAVLPLPAADVPVKDSPEKLLIDSRAAFKAGKTNEALTLATRAVEAGARNPKFFYFRGSLLEALHQPAKAVDDYDAAIKLNPKAVEIIERRGELHFKLGHFPESIADFDRVIAIAPPQGPHHWQRGIALYYAGRFEDGRKQFESHQTVNPNDVENAVWHYLCVARLQGVEKARAALIDIQGDGRVPMMEIYALFRGKLKPDDVLKAATAGDPPAARLRNQLCYAHLYLGLYYEAAGNEKLAREHIFKAAGEFSEDHYMGEVAQVHAALFRKTK